MTVSSSLECAPATKKKVATNPDRLKKFMDLPSTNNATRVKPTAEIKAQTKVSSWNGELCDTRAFESRLAPADQVILGSDQRSHRLLGIDSALNGVPPSGLMLSRHVPVRESSETTGPSHLTAPLLVQREAVAHGAEIRHEPVPSSVFLHEQGLLTPAQRRERLQFETTFHGARRIMAQAERDTRRLHQIVHARHSTCDVLNTDGCSGGEGVGHRVRGEAYNPDLLSHPSSSSSISSSSSSGQYPREYQKKMDASTPKMDTHSRLFNETPVTWSHERAQHLRNESHAGRPYDIVTGGVVAHFPPTIAEKQHTRQGHPSVILHPYTR